MPPRSVNVFRNDANTLTNKQLRESGELSSVRDYDDHQRHTTPVPISCHSRAGGNPAILDTTIEES